MFADRGHLEGPVSFEIGSDKLEKETGHEHIILGM